MARKNRSIAGFDQVAGNNNTNNNENINENTNNNINNTNNTNDSDALESLLNVEDKPKRVLKGIYFDKDIADTLDRLSAGQGPKGKKSEIVNKILREWFEENGYI